MNSAVLSLMIFVSVILGIASIYSIMMDMFLRDRTKLSDRLQKEFLNKQREKAKRTPLFKDFDKVAAELRGGELSFNEKMQNMIDQAGMEWTVGKLMGMSVGLGIFCAMLAALPFLTSDFITLGIAIVIGGGVGGMIPYSLVKVKQRGRIEKMRSQLPETFELMSRVIRAGQTMEQAMHAVADEFSPPIALEFALCHEMMNLGIDMDLALKDMARRSGIMELRIFVMGVLIQKDVGGNMAELMDNLSKIVRERFRINGQIAALTAEGRMQAMVLMALPPGMLVIMTVLNASYVAELFKQPILLGMMVLSEGLGYLWIRKIVNFDF
ncbi:Bacterial type II secretion system protein F domain protein [Planctomycetales bacterium 10988]|nr:Bacterial type II secretion system protein F domain protein [Planctomycetales bacterium 10988]